MTHNKHNDSYCPELWQRIFINQVNDQWHVKPCCYATPTELNSMMIQDGSRIFEIYNNNPNIQNIRQKNLEGIWDPGCLICKRNEDSMGASGRTHALEQLQDNIVESSYVDLNLGNLCNLACAICDPNSSTSWVPIYDRMNDEKWSSIKYIHKNRPEINDPAWFSKIRRLQLQGGEIFLQPNYINFFRNLSQHRNLRDIEVRIFTNGTVRPNPELWNLLQQVGHVSLYVSVDDIGKRFEYQRHGAAWNTVIENIQWFIEHAGENFELGIHPTYSILNVYYLDELVDYFVQEFPSLLRNYGNYFVGTGPLSAHQLPRHLRDAISTKLSRHTELKFISDYIKIDVDQIDCSVFDYIDRYDRATGNSYRQTHPEFWDLLQEYKK